MCATSYNRLLEKVAYSQKLIRAYADKLPVVMCSFGKDSSVLLHLIRDTLPRNEMCAHKYPMPVIFFRQPWFRHKYASADKIAQEWDIELYDLLPSSTGLWVKPERLELAATYSLGKVGHMSSPLNTDAPSGDGDYICGLLDWLMRPVAPENKLPWETFFMGSKSSDVDNFLGKVPLVGEVQQLEKASIVYPLENWTDNDVWDYIDMNDVPIDHMRYDVSNRREWPNKAHNTDHITACTLCIDPRNQAHEVMCPKLNRMVPNRGATVNQIDSRPANFKLAAA